MFPTRRKNFHSHSGAVVCSPPNSCKIPTAHYLEKGGKNRYPGNVITQGWREKTTTKKKADNFVRLTCCRSMSAASIWQKRSWETTFWFLPGITAGRCCGYDSLIEDSTTAQSNFELACRIQVRQTRPESVWRATSKAQRPKGVFLKRYTQGQQLNNSWK